MPTRLLPLSLTLALSACVTTVTIAPRDLQEVAGLGVGQEAKVATSGGVRTVSGEQRITLHPRAADGASYDLTLSQLHRLDDDALALPPDDGPGARLALSQIADGQMRLSSTPRTLGLVGLVVLGVAATAIGGLGAVCALENGCFSSESSVRPEALARRQLR